jgi:hypothetical protein
MADATCAACLTFGYEPHTLRQGIKKYAELYAAFKKNA